jgi:hypothetical protein
MRRFLVRRPAGLPRAIPLAAAVALLVGAYVHWCLWRKGYRVIPKIGTMFELNVAASAAAALVLCWRDEVVVRLGALAVAVGTLAAFALTRTRHGLFGFQERGLQPSPQATIALVAELTVTLLLVASFLWDLRPARSSVEQL